MKKIKVLAISILLGIIFVGCSSNPKNEKQVANIEIKNGTFVKVAKQKDKEDILELDVKIKNNSDEKLMIMEDSFYLVEEGNDEKIASKDMTGSDFGTMNIYKKIINGDLSSDKSLSGKVFFDVKSDKKYTLNFTSYSFDEKTGDKHADVKIPLDLEKYEKSKKKLEDPLKAFEAYVDVVFLDKENKNYEDLVVNDKEKDKEILKKEFSKVAKDYFFTGNISDEKITKMFEQYSKEQASKYKIESDLVYSLSDMALIDVKISGMNSDSLVNAILKEKSAYSEVNEDFDIDKENNYVIENFDKVLKNGEVNHLNDGEITLVKEDNKWSIELDSDQFYDNKILVNSFFGYNY